MIQTSAPALAPANDETAGLTLAPDLQLPLETLSQVMGIIGQRGSGKSFTAAVLTEEMVGRGLFVGYIDPLGIAWGLRASADAGGAGLPMLLLGGQDADLPLEPTAGRIVSQFVLEVRQPLSRT